LYLHNKKSGSSIKLHSLLVLFFILLHAFVKNKNAIVLAGSIELQTNVPPVLPDIIYGLNVIYSFKRADVVTIIRCMMFDV